MQTSEHKMLKGYRLEERIGAGGFGAVYRAKQSTIDREVAIKIILPSLANNPDFIRRFESEAHLIARLEHPHITPLYDYWRDPDGAYLVMRYLRGESIREALQNDGAYPLKIASHLLDQIASALDFAHRANVIHRDIKPANILLDEDGNAYLADFGIAKDLAITDGQVTGADMIVGSLDYISPEQARSEPVTGRTDIYSLGVTLYEMITGEHPFKEASSMERLYKHINDPLPDIVTLSDDVCDAVNEVIHKATAKDPAHRYEDALSFAMAFREAVGSETRTSTNIIEALTLREQEILGMIARGKSNRDIANELVVTIGTVKWHIRQIYTKLGVRSRVQAIVRARELHLIGGDTTADAHFITGDSALTIALPEPENPYKGLRAFQSVDARDFFGREELTQKLIERLQEKVPFQRFMAVIGPSGSGKSSLVRAGLIPALWRGALPNSDKWFVVEMMPASYPLDKLETALIRVASNQASNLREQLQRDERGLLRVADIILPNDDSELIIVIDQFEEVFTLLEDEQERQHYLNLIRTAVTDKRSRVRVIITLRADYYDRPLHYPEFGELLRARMETVLPLSAKGLERAIRAPAERVGVKFEQGLVEQIISTMNYQSGALPLLQYALTELFDRRQERLITHEAYQQIGGAVGALANRADELYTSFSPEAKTLTQQMFMRLVTLGEGAEDTRRRTMQAELLSLTENTDLMEEIIEQFVAYRLLSLDNDAQTRQPIVEVAHEAILREWQRLRAWINDSRTELRLQNQLAGLVADWRKADEETSYLLRGNRLQAFEAWQASTSISLTPHEKRYLETSFNQRTREATEEEARQAREAQLERRGQRFLQIAVGVFAVATLIALALAFIAFDREAQAEQALSLAERESNVNRSLVLAYDAISLHQGQRSKTELALLIALEAVSIDNPPEDAVRALATLARGMGTRAVLTGHSHSVVELVASPDNRLLASGSCADVADDDCRLGEIMLWDLLTLTQIIKLDVEEAGWVTGLSFSPDSETLASSHENGAIVLWDASNGERIAQFKLHEGAVNALAYHPQIAQIASAGDDGLVHLWDAETGDIVQTFVGHEGRVKALAFNHDGAEMLSGGADGLLMLWDVATGELLMTFEQPSEALGIEQVAFDRTHNWVIATNTERHAWDKTSGQHIYTSKNSLRTHGLAIGDDGKVYEGMGRTIRIESPNQEGATVTADVFYDHEVVVRDVAITPDNRLLVTGDDDGIVRVWNLNAQRARRIPIMTSSGRVTLSPDGAKLAVATFYGQFAGVYDMQTGDMLYQVEEEFPMVWLVKFSPDGRYLLVGSINFFVNDTDTTLSLWDAETGDLLRRFEGHNLRLSGVDFTSDGRYLVSTSQSFAQIGELLMWDVETGELLHRFDTEDALMAAGITQDGRYIMAASYFLKYVGIWDIATQEMLRQRHFDTHIEWAQLGADSTTVLVGLDDGRFLELSLDTLETMRSFDGHTGTVWDIAISRDGRLMASGQSGGIAIVWDYVTGRELNRIEHPGGFQVNVSFGADNKTVFTSAYTNEVLEWHISDQSLEDLLAWTRANRYIRELTCTERETYRIEPYCDS